MPSGPPVTPKDASPGKSTADLEYVPPDGDNEMEGGVFPIKRGSVSVAGGSTYANAKSYGVPAFNIIHPAEAAETTAIQNFVEVYRDEFKTCKHIKFEFIFPVPADMEDGDTVEWDPQTGEIETWAVKCIDVVATLKAKQKKRGSKVYFKKKDYQLTFKSTLAIDGPLPCAPLSSLSRTTNRKSVAKLDGVIRQNGLILAALRKFCPLAAICFEIAPGFHKPLGSPALANLVRASQRDGFSTTTFGFNTNKMGGPSSSQTRARCIVLQMPMLFGPGAFLVQAISRPRMSIEDIEKREKCMLYGQRFVRDPLSPWFTAHTGVLQKVWSNLPGGWRQVFNAISMRGNTPITVCMAEMLVLDPDLKALKWAVEILEKSSNDLMDVTKAKKDNSKAQEYKKICGHYKELLKKVQGKTDNQRRVIAVGCRHNFPEVYHHCYCKTLAGPIVVNTIDAEVMLPWRLASSMCRMWEAKDSKVSDKSKATARIRDVPSGCILPFTHMAVMEQINNTPMLKEMAAQGLLDMEVVKALEKLPERLKEYIARYKTSPFPVDLKWTRTTSPFVAHMNINAPLGVVYESFTAWALAVGLGNTNGMQQEVTLGPKHYITMSDEEHMKWITKNDERLNVQVAYEKFVKNKTRLVFPEEFIRSEKMFTPAWPVVLRSGIAKELHVVWQLCGFKIASVVASSDDYVCKRVNACNEEGEFVIATMICPKPALAARRDGDKIIRFFSKADVEAWDDAQAAIQEKNQRRLRRNSTKRHKGNLYVNPTQNSDFPVEIIKHLHDSNDTVIVNFVEVVTKDTHNQNGWFEEGKSNVMLPSEILTKLIFGFSH